MRGAFCGAQMLAGMLVGLAPPALAQPTQIARDASAIAEIRHRNARRAGAAG